MSSRHTLFPKIVLLLVATSITTLARAGALIGPTHAELVTRVAGMVHDPQTRALAGKHKLNVVNVMWEDTGRFKGSSVGPNISDVTIEVQYEDRQSKLRTQLMPVLRYPNFSDKTADLKLSRFSLPVGNERAPGALARVPLADILAHPSRYLSFPNGGRIRGDTLLAKRDTHVLVSAQAAFLPLRKNGSTTFWPVIFNYQSTQKHPAVLTLLVTRQGTSVRVIDNRRDKDGALSGRSWGQRLYFNHRGKRAPLSAERESRVRRRGHTANGEAAASLGADANVLMLIQIPLEVPRPRLGIGSIGMLGLMGQGYGGGGLGYGRGRGNYGLRARSDVERAVLGHGAAKGPFRELGEHVIARDPRFPIRVTLQFYQATSNGVVSAKDIARFAAQIDAVYKKGDFVGSLVTTGTTQRPTEWDGAGKAPPHLCIDQFPGLKERLQRFGWFGGWAQLGRFYRR